MDNKNETNLKEDKPAEKRSPKETLYSKIPLSYKQVSVIIYLLLAVMVAVIVLGVLKGIK